MKWPINGRWFLAISILLMWAMFVSHHLIAFGILALAVCIYGAIICYDFLP